MKSGYDYWTTTWRCQYCDRKFIGIPDYKDGICNECYVDLLTDARRNEK